MSAERVRLWVVFLIGLSVIGLEVVSFQALCFVNDYLTATQVISIALLGLAAGGVLSYAAHRYREETVLFWSLCGLPLSFALSFFAIVRLNPWPLAMMAVLTLPYVIASLCLSLFFGRLQPGSVYLFDLAGAGAGALLVALLVPLLREEGSFIVLFGIASLPLLLYGLKASARAQAGRAAVRVGAGLAAVSLLLLLSHLVLDPFNLMRIATADYEVFPRKLFRAWDEHSDEPRYELAYSRGSLIERIDIVEVLRKGKPRKRRLWNSVYNGRVVDIIDTGVAHPGWLDNRLPTLLRLGEDPDTLLVGPSGQGLTKAVQALGKGHIDAVEINGAIAGLMAGPMFKRSGRAYAGMELTVGDVRTFLRRTERKYDFITLLNTHRIWSMGHQGPPEYIHTVEAMRDYFAHLKARGFLLFEERNINERADLGIRRMVQGAKHVMAELGLEHPERHFAIWELYHNCTRSGVEAMPSRCRRSQLFTFVMIKRTPIDDAEQEHLREWGETLGARRDKGMGYRGIVWRYLPKYPTEHYWTDVVRASDIYETPGVDRKLHVLDPVYDDRPFPWEVFRKPGAAHRMLADVALLALLMVLLPTVLTFVARRREQVGPNSLVAGVVLLPFFAVLGLGYLVIEVVLIQKFGIFLASPAYSLAVVLSTVLIASGAGGYVSRRASGRACLGALAAVVTYGVFMATLLDPLLGALMFLPSVLRVVAAIVLIAPAGFAMGFPFPYALQLAKERLSERHAGLYFGINGAMGAVATPLTLISSMEYGFARTSLFAAGAYLVCLVLLAALVWGRPPAPAG